MKGVASAHDMTRSAEVPLSDLFGMFAGMAASPTVFSAF